jgi:hypothetical protein
MSQVSGLDFRFSKVIVIFAGQIGLNILLDFIRWEFFQTIPKGATILMHKTN